MNLRRPSTLLLAALLCLAPASASSARPWAGGAAAAAHPLGSAAAQQMLEAGGNAVDAAVAAAFTMAVVGPYHSGLGGGGFAVIHLVDGRDLAFDFREVAPAAATRDMFLTNGVADKQRSTDGALAIAVPGAVKGYLELHAKHGKLPRAVVLGPAIKAARDGFLVTPRYAELARRREACLRSDPEAVRIFLRPGPDGVPAAPALGTVLKQPDLARTLGLLARAGDAPFYGGAVGQAVVRAVQAAGGLLTLQDLKGYATHWRTPLEGHYRGHRFLSLPPPSSGGILLAQTLGMLEARGSPGPASREVTALHTFIEALRLAYVDRARFLGDPAFVDVPVARLTSTEHVAELAARIDPTKATRSATLMPPELRAPVSPDGGQKNTTHISVIDAAGNAVALTTTVNFWFGSCLVAKGTGVLLNDQMDDFAVQPGVPNVFGLVGGEANAVAPGKRPLSSMSPTLVFQKDRPGEVMLAVGSPGGSTIPTTVMQVMSFVIDGQLDVARAVGRGRLHHQWLPDEVWFDQGALDPATMSGLTALGHTLKLKESWGDAEAVLVDPVTGVRTAASDPRNEGAPAGTDLRR